MTEEAFLSQEEALVLLEELREFLPKLDAGVLEDQTLEKAERLVEGLNRLPLPPDVQEDHRKEMGMWTELLLSERREERENPGRPLARQLEDRVLRLKGMVEDGVEP